MWANGDYYVGEIKVGIAQGTYTGVDGGKYVGEWKNGKRHGEGTNTYASGNKYVGQFRDGNFHGLGKYTFANGKVHHDGEWVNNEPKK